MVEQEVIHNIRVFNRFYTNVIAVLDQNVLKSGFSLAEARILFEIQHLQPCSARRIMEVIIIDEGYLSRILKKMVINGHVLKVQSESDKRQYLLKLSAKGQEQMHRLDRLANESTLQLINKLSPDQTNALLENMQNIQELLNQ